MRGKHGKAHNKQTPSPQRLFHGPAGGAGSASSRFPALGACEDSFGKEGSSCSKSRQSPSRRIRGEGLLAFLCSAGAPSSREGPFRVAGLRRASARRARISCTDISLSTAGPLVHRTPSAIDLSKSLEEHKIGGCSSVKQ